MRRSPWCVSDMKNPRACEGSRVGALLPARGALRDARRAGTFSDAAAEAGAIEPPAHTTAPRTDRKNTRLNSSHVANAYVVFCLKKKTIDDGKDDELGI